MTEYEVRDSYRNVKRRMQRAMQKSYIKVLTEPITNSDDSYKRLNVTTKKPIIIYVTERERKFEIVDHGEGLNSQEMANIFKWYGQERKTHDTTSRGIFCQGLSDVLFTRERGGNLFSIKDGEVFHTEFKWKTKKTGDHLEKIRTIIVSDEKLKAGSEWRKKLKIPDGNGTNVTFHFIETSFPTREEIVKKLCNFYMLRFITSDPLREIKVVFLRDGEPIEEIPIHSEILKGDMIQSIETEIKYKSYPKIKITGEIFKHPNDLPQEEAGEDRIGGLLIFDEYKNVYDLTLLSYEGNPHAKKIFGFIELSTDFKLKNVTGFKQVIRNELSNDEEILTDTRDGFFKSNKKSSFYSKLKEAMESYLKKIIERETVEENLGQSNLSEESIEEQQKAFDILNKLYEEYNEATSLGEDEGKKDKKPERGLEFDRKFSVITKNKKYYIGLRVNLDQIPLGSKIKIFASKNNLKFKPEFVEIKEGNEYGVFKTKITIKGLLPDSLKRDDVDLLAKFEDYQSKVEIKIIEEEVYIPTNDFEFNPKDYKSKPGNINKLHLYIDKNIILTGTKIKFKVTQGKKIRLTEFDEIVFQDDHIIKDNIALIKIPYVGYEEEKGEVTASCYDKETQARIEISYKEPKEKGKMFDGWDYKPLTSSYPLATYYNDDTRKIEINSNIESNSKFLGKDYSEATLNYERFLHCQIIVAERILDECITATVNKAFYAGKIDVSDPVTNIRRIIASEKKKIGPEIIKHFVKNKSIKEIYETAEAI